MASSITKPQPGSLGKTLPNGLDSIRAGESNLRIDAKNFQNSPEFRAFRHLVREAMRESGLSQKEFALDAGQSEGHISDAFAGNRKLDADWVWRQKSKAFHAALTRLMRAEQGLGDEESEAEYEQQIGLLVTSILRHRRKAAV
jgi:hypothetical protein